MTARRDGKRRKARIPKFIQHETVDLLHMHICKLCGERTDVVGTIYYHEVLPKKRRKK